MTPTSHILKTQLGQLPNGVNLSDSVENEFFCMLFCAAMGAEVADVETVDFDGVRALVIERFDRQWTKDGRLLRIPRRTFARRWDTHRARSTNPTEVRAFRDALNC